MSKMTDADWLRKAAGTLDGAIIAADLARLAADLERIAKRLEEIDGPRMSAQEAADFRRQIEADARGEIEG